MLSKLVRYASKPMTIALLINLVLWIPRLLDKTSEMSALVVWLTGIVLIAATTLVTYVALVVVDKALKFAGSLLKRIPRGGAKGIIALGMVSIFLFSSIPVAEANPQRRGMQEAARSVSPNDKATTTWGDIKLRKSTSEIN